MIFSIGDIRSENAKRPASRFHTYFLHVAYLIIAAVLSAAGCCEYPGGEPARQYRMAARALVPPKRQLCTSTADGGHTANRQVQHRTIIITIQQYYRDYVFFFFCAVTFDVIRYYYYYYYLIFQNRRRNRPELPPVACRQLPSTGVLCSRVRPRRSVVRSPCSPAVYRVVSRVCRRPRELTVSRRVCF